MKVQTDVNRTFIDDASIKSSDEEDLNEFQMGLDNETRKTAIENLFEEEEEDEKRA